MSEEGVESAAVPAEQTPAETTVVDNSEELAEAGEETATGEVVRDEKEDKQLGIESGQTESTQGQAAQEEPPTEADKGGQEVKTDEPVEGTDGSGEREGAEGERVSLEHDGAGKEETEETEDEVGKQQVEAAFSEEREPLVDVGVTRMEEEVEEDDFETVEEDEVGDNREEEEEEEEEDGRDSLEEEQGLQPGTPDLEQEDEEEPDQEVEPGLEEEEEPVPEIDKEELIDKYLELHGEFIMSVQVNTALQHRITEYFNRHKQNDDQEDLARRAVADHEQRYNKCMHMLQAKQNEMVHLTEDFERHIAMACEEVKHRQLAVEDYWENYLGLRTATSLRSVSFRTGKLMQQRELDELHAAEQRKDEDLQMIRLAHIRMRNKLKKQEAQLKEEEKLGDGGDLHVIDFEQLKIENQTFSEKIEERNDEVIKMRKKIESSLQMLAHVKEKLAFILEGNTFQTEELKSVEEHVKEKRNRLNHVKHIRDALRFENTRLRQQSGLLGREPLLRDFELKQDRASELRQRIEDLRQLQMDLTAQCHILRQKVEQSQPLASATFA